MNEKIKSLSYTILQLSHQSANLTAKRRGRSIVATRSRPSAHIRHTAVGGAGVTAVVDGAPPSVRVGKLVVHRAGWMALEVLIPPRAQLRVLRPVSVHDLEKPDPLDLPLLLLRRRAAALAAMIAAAAAAAAAAGDVAAAAAAVAAVAAVLLALR